MTDPNDRPISTLDVRAGQDRIGAVATSYENGWRSGFVEGGLAALEPILEALQGVTAGSTVNLDTFAPLRELVRRFGAGPVELKARDRSGTVQAAVQAVVQQLASRPTPPDRPTTPVCSNGPEEIGARGQPGGWTGGLTSPVPSAPPKRGRRK